MNMSSPDRRRRERTPIDIDATIITPLASYRGRALDISADGIRVVAPYPVPPDTDIALSLSTKSETLLSGVILWTIEVEREEMPPAFEMGIEAHGFILKEQEAIAPTDRETMIREILSRISKTSD